MPTQALLIRTYLAHTHRALKYQTHNSHHIKTGGTTNTTPSNADIRAATHAYQHAEVRRTTHGPLFTRQTGLSAEYTPTRPQATIHTLP